MPKHLSPPWAPKQSPVPLWGHQQCPFGKPSGTAGIGVPSLLPWLLAKGPQMPRNPSRGSGAVALRDLNPNKHHDVTLSKPCKRSA